MSWQLLAPNRMETNSDNFKLKISMDPYLKFKRFLLGIVLK